MDLPDFEIFLKSCSLFAPKCFPALAAKQSPLCPSPPTTSVLFQTKRPQSKSAGVTCRPATTSGMINVTILITSLYFFPLFALFLLSLSSSPSSSPPLLQSFADFSPALHKLQFLLLLLSLPLSSSVTTSGGSGGASWRHDPADIFTRCLSLRKQCSSLCKVLHKHSRRQIRKYQFPPRQFSSAEFPQRFSSKFFTFGKRRERKREKMAFLKWFMVRTETSDWKWLVTTACLFAPNRQQMCSHLSTCLCVCVFVDDGKKDFVLKRLDKSKMRLRQSEILKGISLSDSEETL